jgi:hypothetical protein
MTSAHRATYKPATGSNNQGGNIFAVSTRQYSAKDIQGHGLVKDRKSFQKNYDQLFHNGPSDASEIKSQLGIGSMSQIPVNSANVRKPRKPRTECAEVSLVDPLLKELDQQTSKRRKQLPDEDQSSNKDQRDLGEEGNEEEEDEMADLLKEYERLKQVKEKRQGDKPLPSEKSKLPSSIQEDSRFQLKKRWHEETIFQNQSLKDKGGEGQHSNDLLRSDKHKRLLRRYILT